MKSFLSLAGLVGLAAAQGVTLQLFDGGACNTNKAHPDKVVANVNTNSAAAQQGSGCIAVNFKSAKFLKFTNGFKCNLYSDPGCGNFIQDLTANDACDSFSGQSVECFSQTDFDNPFADSQVSITVGQKDVGVTQNTDSLFEQGISKACSDTGCDPTNMVSFPYRHFNQNGQTTISVTGSYSNTNQRDYMKALLEAVQAKTLHNLGVDLKGSSENDDLTANQFTFFQIVIRDPNGNIQCQMTVTINTTTQKQQPGDCGIVGTLESAALGAVPAVGGLLAKAFQFTCQHAN